MSETAQADLDGETLDEEFSAEIDAKNFVPWLRNVDSYKEFKVGISESGLSVSVVDPDTIMMTETTLHPEAFNRFNVGADFPVGVSRTAINRAVSFARYGKGSDDTIEIEYNDFHKFEVTVDRDIHGIDATADNTIALIDPASVRKEPDLPDLDFSAEATIPAKAFNRFVKEVSKVSDHIAITVDSGSITFSGEGETDDVSLTAHDVADGSGHSLYSIEYVMDIGTSIVNAKADDVTIEMADEHPMIVQFDRDDKYSTRHMVAPRLTS